MPLVTVITPVYNSAQTLRRACRSLAAQDLTDWEHVIVDDGSTDSSLAIARAVASSAPNIRVIATENRGPGAALNRGIQEAEGEFIAFLDADDEFLESHLRLHVEYLRERADVDLVWGGAEVIVRNPEDAMVPDMVQGHGLVHVSECVVQGTLFTRRNVTDTFRFTEDREIWYQDLEFVQRVSRSHKIARFPHETYRYYRDSGVSLVDRVKAAATSR